MGVEAKEYKRRILLHSMAALARRTMANTTCANSGSSAQAIVTHSLDDSAVDSASSSTIPLPRSAQHDESALRKEPLAGPCILPTACQPRITPLGMSWLRLSQSSPRLLGPSMLDQEAVDVVAVDNITEIADDDDFSGGGSYSPEHTSNSIRMPPKRATSLLVTSSDHTSDESIVYAVALLRKLQQHAYANENGEAAVQREELDQILSGFSHALKSVTSTWDERSVENTVQTLFDTHSNVFDESMQNYIIQNFLHESGTAKTFRTALRRTSVLRRCLLAMYPPKHSNDAKRSNSMGDDKGIATRRWSEAVARIMKQKEDKRQQISIEVCPEITNPSIVLAVKNEIANINSWNFDVFAVRCCCDAVDK